MNDYDLDQFDSFDPPDELMPESKFNPRVVSCPLCGADDALTADEADAGYVCKRCMVGPWE